MAIKDYDFSGKKIWLVSNEGNADMQGLLQKFGASVTTYANTPAILSEIADCVDVSPDKTPDMIIVDVSSDAPGYTFAIGGGVKGSKLPIPVVVLCPALQQLRFSFSPSGNIQTISKSNTPDAQIDEIATLLLGKKGRNLNG